MGVARLIDRIREAVRTQVYVVAAPEGDEAMWRLKCPRFDGERDDKKRISRSSPP